MCFKVCLRSLCKTHVLWMRSHTSCVLRVLFKKVPLVPHTQAATNMERDTSMPDIFFTVEFDSLARAIRELTFVAPIKAKAATAVSAADAAAPSAASNKAKESEISKAKAAVAKAAAAKAAAVKEATTAKAAAAKAAAGKEAAAAKRESEQKKKQQAKGGGKRKRVKPADTTENDDDPDKTDSDNEEEDGVSGKKTTKKKPAAKKAKKETPTAKGKKANSTTTEEPDADARDEQKTASMREELVQDYTAKESKIKANLIENAFHRRNCEEARQLQENKVYGGILQLSLPASPDLSESDVELGHYYSLEQVILTPGSFPFLSTKANAKRFVHALMTPTSAASFMTTFTGTNEDGSLCVMYMINDVRFRTWTTTTKEKDSEDAPFGQIWPLSYVGKVEANQKDPEYEKAQQAARDVLKPTQSGVEKDG